jgi:CubicO group peptidase (beta-lactamase class C family)
LDLRAVHGIRPRVRGGQRYQWSERCPDQKSARPAALVNGDIYLGGGAYRTYFWVDPVEKLIGILMTQLRPNNHVQIRSDFVGLATQAIAD